MFFARPKEWGDETDDCPERQESNRFEEVELPEDGVLEQDPKEKTSGSGDSKERPGCKVSSVTEDQVAELAEIDLGLESA